MVDIVTLPNCPVPGDATLSLVSYATEMTGPLGGPTQRVIRVGSRFRLDLSYPPMPYDEGRQFLSRLNRAEASPVAIGFPQRGLHPVYPGPLVVNGAAVAPINSGGQLGVRAGTPAAEFLDGQFFHVASGGRRWVHQVVGDTVLDATGSATIGVVPLLRFVPQDGDALEFVNPLLEGFVARGWNWSVEMLNRVGLKVSVTEDR